MREEWTRATRRNVAFGAQYLELPDLSRKPPPPFMAEQNTEPQWGSTLELASAGLADGLKNFSNGALIINYPQI